MTARHSHLTKQEAIMRYIGITILLTVIFATPCFVAGAIMLMPEHSRQAQPKLADLAAITETYTDRDDHQDIYQGWEPDDTAQSLQEADECPEPPAASRDYLPLHITVAEGDRDIISNLIVIDAERHGAQAKRYSPSFRLRYDQGWDAHLAALKPWRHPPEQTQETAGYAAWAEAAAQRIAASEPLPLNECRPLPYHVELRIAEINAGAVSDAGTRFFAYILLVVGGVISIACVVHPALDRRFY